MLTRKQYLNQECSFHEYYSQFVTASIKQTVLRNFTVDTLKEKLAEDKWLNSLPLNQWDIMGIGYRQSLSKAFKEKGDFWSLAGSVCVFKTAAKMIVEENNSASN